MPAPDLIIFDCDGVLVDSEIVAARNEAGLLTEAGYPVTTEDVVERFAGMTFPDILKEVEREAGIPFQMSLIDKSEKLVDERLAREVKPIPGAAQALTGARTPICVCSNSSMARLDITLGRTGLKPLVEGRVYSASDLGLRNKPAPDVFLHAAKAQGADPARTFVVEDSVPGVTAARAAGMRVIGFTGGSHSYPTHADRLIEAGAETVINRLADLHPLVSAMAEFGALDS